jgi:hypothetical protein
MRQQLATCTFQLSIYKKLSQKLRQEVVQAKDDLAMAKMHHLNALNALRREADVMKQQLTDSLSGTGVTVRYNTFFPVSR